MIRYTRKYRRARAIAPDFPRTTNDQLYQHLFSQGYTWNPRQQEWVKVQPEDNKPPDEQIHIRVATDRRHVKAVAEEIATFCEKSGYRLLKQSVTYPCRPPKANDGRVYITLEKKWRNPQPPDRGEGVDDS